MYNSNFTKEDIQIKSSTFLVTYKIHITPQWRHLFIPIVQVAGISKDGEIQAPLLLVDAECAAALKKSGPSPNWTT